MITSSTRGSTASEGAFRTAKQRLAAGSRGNGSDTDDADNIVRLPPPGEPVPVETVDELLTTTIQQDSLRTLIAQIIFELEALKRNKVREAEAILRETMDQLAPLVDQRKVA